MHNTTQMKPKTPTKESPPQRSIETRLFLAETPPVGWNSGLDFCGDDLPYAALRALDVSPDGQY
jgi:hypothetical protein